MSRVAGPAGALAPAAGTAVEAGGAAVASGALVPRLAAPRRYPTLLTDTNVRLHAPAYPVSLALVSVTNSDP